MKKQQDAGTTFWLSVKMDGASSFMKEANAEVAKTFILLIGQQRPPKTVAKSVSISFVGLNRCITNQ